MPRRNIDWRQKWILNWIVPRIIRIVEVHLVMVVTLWHLFIEIHLAVLYTCVPWWFLILSCHVLQNRPFNETLCMYWLGVILSFKQFLMFDHFNVLISTHSRVVVIAWGQPWGIGDLLHLQKCIWLEFIFSFCILVLFVEELLIVFSWVNQADVLFQLLLE